MREPLQTIPYNYAKHNDYPNVPEFVFPRFRKLRWAKPGELTWGDNSCVFASQNFATCSAFLIRSRNGLSFGLLHASPTQHLAENSFGQTLEDFRVFEGGQVLLVEGSTSAQKPWLLDEFSNELGLSHAGTIPVDTMSPDRTTALFHIAFRPQTNHILVVRDALKDLQIYSGFDQV